MNLNRSNALGTSTLSHITCQLAHHFLDLNELGRAGVIYLAADVALQLTAEELKQVEADAARDHYCWGIAPAADVTTAPSCEGHGLAGPLGVAALGSRPDRIP
jgi:hypothetical protein